MLQIVVLRIDAVRSCRRYELTWLYFDMNCRFRLVMNCHRTDQTVATEHDDANATSRQHGYHLFLCGPAYTTLLHRRTLSRNSVLKVKH